MWTLAPGLTATIQRGWGELRSLATGERWDVRPEDLSIVRALALGIPEADAGQHRELPAAAKLGWAVQATTTEDAHVRARLEKLERHFSWCAAPPAAAHAAVLASHASRRHLHRGFSQHPALPETIARRAALLGNERHNVLVLGDDDFTSVALVALGHEVTVLEPDVAIAERVRRSAPCEVVAYDPREPLPVSMVGSFDAFFAEPLSGEGPLRVYLARGLAALKPGRQGYVCVSEASSIETIAREFTAEITQQYTDFNHYYGYDYTLGFYTSDLAIVCASEQTQLKPRPEEPYLTRGMRLEDEFFETAATRYSFKNINPETSQLIHLDKAFQLLEHMGRLQIRNKSFFEHEGVRSYLVHTKEGVAVFVRLMLDAKVGELFVTPADGNLENALLTVLFGPLGIQGALLQKRRVRGSTVYTMT